MTRTPVVTHYCDWDAPGRLFVAALCGVYIRRRDHDNDPTCDDCRRALLARERTDDETAVSETADASRDVPIVRRGNRMGRNGDR